MDVTRKVLCGSDLFNPVLSMGLQASLLLSVSHLLQIAVKSVGIPTPIPQITVGSFFIFFVNFVIWGYEEFFLCYIGS